MIGYSVIIPQRDCGDAVRRQLPALNEVLTQLGRPFEIIIADDGSSPATHRQLEKLLGEFQSLRLLRLDAPCGASVALSAGMAASRGEVVLAIEPGDRYPVGQIPALVQWLNRADLIVGRRRRTGLAKLWQRVGRIPRWLLLGLESHDPDCLFWAARREVVAGINFTAGMGRYLPSLAVRRGFRVCETYVEDRGGRRLLQDVRPNVGDLLAAWWLCRRWRENNAYELFTNGSARGILRVVSHDDQADGTDQGDQHQGVLAWPAAHPATSYKPAKSA